MMTLRETYMDLIYMGSRKRQDVLSKLRAWGPWERVEVEEEAGTGAEKNVELNKNLFKNEQLKLNKSRKEKKSKQASKQARKKERKKPS